MKGFKKKPHHYAEKKKKDTRKVLSFEELPLEEYEKEQSAPAVKLDKKKVIIASAIVLALVLVVTLYFSRGSIASCIGRGNSDDFTHSLSGASVQSGNFRDFAGGIAYVSEKGFTCLNSKGEELYTESLGYINPVLKTCSDAAITYDLGAKGFAVFSDEKQIYRSETDENIYLADITAEADYALVTDSSGYNAKLMVYSSDNTLKYTYSFADYYITSVALNSDATEAVVCGVTAENGAEKSSIYILDFKSETPKAFKNFSDDTVFDCEYLSSSSVCAIGSKGVYVLKGRGYEEMITNAFSGLTLTGYDINTDLNAVTVSLSRSGDGRNCTIEHIDRNGTTDKTIETNLKITAISTYKDRIAVADGSNVYVYKQSGDLLESKEFSGEGKSINLVSLHRIYMLTTDEIISATL